MSFFRLGYRKPSVSSRRRSSAFEPSPDVTRFPARGVTSLETRVFSGGQLQLGHGIAAEWAAGWLLEGCQRKAERHHRRASRYAGEYSQEDHVLRHRLPSVA